MNNVMKIFATGLCIFLCNCDNTYSMHNSFKQQVIQYILKMNEQDTLSHSDLKYNIINHVYTDSIIDINHIYEDATINNMEFNNSKLIALAMATNNDEVN